jgi:hypothetical protein
MKIRAREVIIAVVVLVILVGIVVLWLRCRADPVTNGAAGQHDVPEGWTVAPTLQTPWLPFHHNEASDYTAEFPAGSSVVVLSTQDGGQVEIGILPDGTVVVPDGYTAVVYKKRPSLIAIEARPFVAAGLGLGGMYGAGGVDIVRVWKLHAGPGVAASYWPGDENPEVGVVGATSVNVWRNVDLVAFGGYGTGGKMAGGGVEIAIQ